MIKLLPLLSLLLAPAIASAGLIAYDSFSVPAGALHDHTGDLVLGPWNVQSQETGYQIIEDGLTYPGLPTQGGAATGGGGYRYSGVNLGQLAPWASPQNGWDPLRYYDGTRNQIGVEGTEFWGSMLVNDLGAAGLQIGFHDTHIAGAQASIGFDFANNGGTWEFRERSGQTLSTGIAAPADTTTLLVFHFEFIDDNSDRITVYVNPTAAVSTPDVTGVTMTTSYDMHFQTMRFYPGSGNDNGLIDEIRFGTSFGSVVIPEPRLAVLLGGLAMLGLLFWRRK